MKRLWMVLPAIVLMLAAVFLLRLAAAPTVGRIIVIDAGHGGFDGGAGGKYTVEKELNLEIALLLKDALERRGFMVVMTRQSDEALVAKGQTVSTKKSDMQERLRRINASKAALLISVHMNHFGDASCRGAQIFYNKSGREAALGIQEALRLMDPTNRRQAKAADGDLYLLTYAEMPACLVECGFLSNPAEEKLLNDPVYRSLLAETVAGAVADWSAAQENTGKEKQNGKSENRFSLQ